LVVRLPIDFLPLLRLFVYFFTDSFCSHPDAQRVGNEYSATIVIWGASFDEGIRLFFEITPRHGYINMPLKGVTVPIDWEYFNQYLLDGMDTLYVVNFVQAQIHFFEGDYEEALTSFEEAASRIPAGREDEVEAAMLYFYMAYAHDLLNQ